MRSLLVARIVAAVAALLALVVVVSSVSAVAAAPTDGLVAEVWRIVGLATWAALFALLAARPRLVALWAIALASKAALVVAGLAVGSAVPGATDLVLWDGILAAILAIGLVAVVLDRRGARETRERSPHAG